MINAALRLEAPLIQHGCNRMRRDDVPLTRALFHCLPVPQGILVEVVSGR